MLFKECLGVPQEVLDEQVTSNKLSNEWLKGYFSKKIDDESTDAEVEYAVKGYLLFMFGCLLFVDKTGTHISAAYLRLLMDYKEIKNYAWGAGILAYMFGALREASRAKVHQIACFVHLLEAPREQWASSDINEEERVHMVRCAEQGAQGQTRSICHSRANTATRGKASIAGGIDHVGSGRAVASLLLWGFNVHLLPPIAPSVTLRRRFYSEAQHVPPPRQSLRPPHACTGKPIIRRREKGCRGATPAIPSAVARLPRPTCTEYPFQRATDEAIAGGCGSLISAPSHPLGAEQLGDRPAKAGGIYSVGSGAIEALHSHCFRVHFRYLATGGTLIPIQSGSLPCPSPDNRFACRRSPSSANLHRVFSSMGDGQRDCRVGGHERCPQPSPSCHNPR
ncbi:hypothetical protein FRX31_005886 [Thalictrum thalictroides]|uniref:Aminotransferase-like plant mobile domain-containing protein n=1 Tax=Thalictrum thalictroides TaxID=46969 RepID=A0A7J6X6M8_THATH|nr:hypothetical protein FRX31_005886 [Thalictrum thalictroides]